MNNGLLIPAGLLAIILGLAAVTVPEAGGAILVVLVLSALVVFVFRYFIDEDKELLTGIFFAALSVRLLFGLLVHVYDLREFFGGDAITYDTGGTTLMEYWTGTLPFNDPEVQRVIQTAGPGWGMNYLVAFLYTLLGKNILAAQSFCAVFGAATAPAIYYCSAKIFNNRNVSKIAAFSIALFPSFIIWSSQLMKDGLIIFLLVLCMIMVLQLQEKFNYAAVVILILSMGGIISLRFYIFYMVAIAVVGSFVIGTTNSASSIARRSIILIVMGLGLTYLGVIRNAGTDFEKYGSLESVQRTRGNLAEAGSGFGEDLDVSTTEGAMVALPVGFAYLMLAPFPWEVSSIRQAITLPEVLLWWAMIPFMIAGLWFAIKHRLRSAFPILLFSLMLTLAYSIFQGNVGTAYRQRTQIQVFLFIFIAVGWTIYKERKEDQKTMANRGRRKLAV